MTEITQADIDALRTLEPRKSILNFSSAELKATEKWAEKFQDELSEKSPFYRLTNGDWRENDSKNTIDIFDIYKKNVDFQIVSNDVKTQIIPRGVIINTDTNWTIQISRRGLEDTLTYARKHKDQNIYSMIYHTNSLVSNSILLDSVITEKNNDNKAFNSIFMHKLYSICRIDKQPCIVKIAIEEFLGSKNDTIKRLYNLQDINIEPIKLATFADKRLAFSVLNGSDISISDLFQIVKTFDKDFYLNKRNEKQIEKFPTGDERMYNMAESTQELLERIAALEKQVSTMAAEQQSLKEQINTVNQFISSITEKAKEPERNMAVGEKDTAPNIEKDGYSIFTIETHGEVMHYRDDNAADIDTLMKRYADCDGYYPAFTENCTRISDAEFAELDQLGDPSFCAEIDVDNNNLTVWDNVKIATTELDTVVVDIKKNNTVGLNYENFPEDDLGKLNYAYSDFLYHNDIFNDTHIEFMDKIDKKELPPDLNTAEKRAVVSEYINEQLDKGNITESQRESLKEIQQAIRDFEEPLFVQEVEKITKWCEEAQEKAAERMEERESQNFER